MEELKTLINTVIAKEDKESPALQELKDGVKRIDETLKARPVSEQPSKDLTLQLENINRKLTEDHERVVAINDNVLAINDVLTYLKDHSPQSDDMDSSVKAMRKSLETLSKIQGHDYTRPSCKGCAMISLK